MKQLIWMILLGAVLMIFACGDNKEGEQSASGMKEPDHIEVQHILIAFQGSINKPGITRTQEEAKEFAYQLLERAKKGEDFDQLVVQYTNDSPPGKYKMANNGIQPDQSVNEFPRAGMVAAFGDVGFKLNVGEIGIADYDVQSSPYGWHIIKRTE